MLDALRPSKAHRWIRCAAAPTLESRVPAEPPGDAAREGTCAAWVAESVLKGDAASAEDLAGETHKNGWLVTPDMVQYVQGYIDMIQARGGVTTAEQYVRLTDRIAGTLDCATSLDAHGVLKIDDLKYGHVTVEVYENPQTIIYGAAEYLRLNNPAIQWVELGIYQPRSFHVDGIYRVWRLSVAELFERVNWIVQRGDECFKPDPIATPGEQCTHCSANTSCAAAARTLYRGWAVVEDTRQRTMTAVELAAELDFLNKLGTILKARQSAVEAEAEARIKGGEHVAGWFMKSRKGHRKFNVAPAVIHALTGINPMREVPMSPPELEREGANLKIVAAITSQPDIGRKLDRMPSNYIAKAFGK